MKDLITKVKDANPKRKFSSFPRRVIKLGEEKGEVDQAYLSVSSKSNSKDKTWADVREELVDVVIVALDLLLHDFPDEDEPTYDEKVDRIHSELDRKLKKWHKKQQKNGDTSEEN
jgi:NTP pyrophosphatase (non-canonical NTP hydrolase)